MSKDNINPDHYKNSTSLECGKVCEQSRFVHYLLFKRKLICTTTNEEKLDLCQECYDSLQDWFQIGFNKVGKKCQESQSQ